MTKKFSWARSLRLGTFHIGSSFADILGSSIWNYVMANGMAAMGGFVATPITLLLALRQLLVPLTILAGHLSDTHPIFGFRRLPYIWIGRGMMLLSLPVLPVATTMIFSGNSLGWLVALFSFLIYGVGTQLSGSPFTALVRDSAPPAKQGLAYAIVQTMLVAAFAFSPLVYAQMARAGLPSYDASASALRQYNLDLFWQATLIGCAIALFTWTISVAGMERRAPNAQAVSPNADYKQFRPVIRAIWADKRARSFFWLLAVGALSGFAQDGILEPSLRGVFGYSFSATQMVVGIWGMGLLIGMIGSIGVTRKWPTAQQTRVAAIGLALSSVSMVWMAVTFALANAPMVIPSIFFFGLGFGIYTAGASPLLMAMTLDNRAGAYLGLWSMAQLLFRGIGVALGGVFFDVLSRVFASVPLGYASVYALEAIGFATCLYFLRASDVKGFVGDTQISAMTALASVD